MLSYNKGIGDYKNWILCEDQLDFRYQGKCESIMALGNGYMGLRSAFEETYVGQTRGLFVAGTFNRFHQDEVTELPNAADISELQIYLNDQLFSMDSGKVLEYSRCLNLRDGELTRQVLWQSPEQEIFRLEFKRFVSLDDLHTVAFKVNVTPATGNAAVKIKTGIDGRMTNSGSQHFREGDKQVYDKVYMQLLQTTTESEIDFVFNCCCTGEAREFGVERRRIYGIYEFEAEKDNTLSFEKIANVFTSRDKEYKNGYDVEKLKGKSLKHLEICASIGYESLLDKSREKWRDYWEKVNIDITSCNGEDLLAVRFAQYHLLIMTPCHDERFSIGAKALTGEGYKGHVFWDTEIFMLPYFQYNMPVIARQLLSYRYVNLEGARKKAEKYGCKGAMFPWESAFTGDEETPEWAALNIMTGKPTRVWAGIKEHHITADIAYAIWQYFLATDDVEFMKNCGYEIIFECAWFWCSRLFWNDELSRYEIRDVIGPDEYTEHIDNNAYTNYMTHYVLSLAVRLYDELLMEQPALFVGLDQKLQLGKRYEHYKSAAEKLYLSKPNEKGIIPQDDTFLNKKEIDISSYRDNDLKQSILLDYSRNQIIDMQVLKQADTVMLFHTLRRLFDKAVIEAGWKYYEPRTIHDSSLSFAVHSIVAAYFNNTAAAYSFFKEACSIDMGQNPISSDTGIHAASMGGIWMAVVLGFGGVFNNEGSLELNPSLPEEWSKLSFSLYWKGSRLHFAISGDSVCLTSDGQNELKLKIYGKEYLLKDALSVQRQEVPGHVC